MGSGNKKRKVKLQRERKLKKKDIKPCGNYDLVLHYLKVNKEISLTNNRR